MARIQVITAGKHGSTEEVGAAIAARLRARGHQAEGAAATDDGAFAGTDGVVLGSAIYIGKWRKPARRLAAALPAAAVPYWLFSVGPLGDPPEPELPPPEALVGAEAATAARGYEVFSGRLDREALGRLERMAVNAQEAPEGDFRDWPRIEAWADSIAAELEAGPAGA